MSRRPGHWPATLTIDDIAEIKGVAPSTLDPYARHKLDSVLFEAWLARRDQR